MSSSMDSRVECEINNIKQNQNEQCSWSMNEIHLICRYLHFHGIRFFFLILGGFLMPVLCLKCLSRVSLVCPHGNPLLHSVAVHSDFFSSERRGLCYPGPWNARHSSFQKSEEHRGRLFAKFEKQKSVWPPQAWFLSLMVWKLQEDWWLISSLYCTREGFWAQLVNPQLGNACREERLRKSLMGSSKPNWSSPCLACRQHLIDMADLSAGEKQRVAPGIQSRGGNWVLLTHFMLVGGWFCWPVLWEHCQG